MSKPLPRPLPASTDLGRLRREARQVLARYRRGEPAAIARFAAFHPRRPALDAARLVDAQEVVARSWSCRSWLGLVRAVAERTVADGARRLRAAIDRDDPDAVAALVRRHPDLRETYLTRDGGYRDQRPLAYACQRGRLAIARLLLAAGADVHADGDLAAARAATADRNLALLDLLLDHGVSVDAEVHGWGPLILYPCECLAPAILELLLARGADPNLQLPQSRCRQPPLAALLGTYARGPQLAVMVEALIAAGARFVDGPVMDLHRGRSGALRQRIAVDPALVHRRFAEPAYGATGRRRLTPAGGTLLHVAAEWCDAPAARLLLAHHAEVDARAETVAGVGGQTPLFHALSQFNGAGLEVAEVLLRAGADPTLVATLPGAYDHPHEVVVADAWGYAARFPGAYANELKPIETLLRAYGWDPRVMQPQDPGTHGSQR